MAYHVAFRLLSPEGAAEFNAFLAMLKWVNEEFNYWFDTQQWSASQRLAMVWSHTHQLFTVFLSTGAPIAWMQDVFEEAWRKLPAETFKRNPDYWFDIAHPWRLNRESFLLTGLSYGFGEKITTIVNEVSRDRISRLVYHDVNDKTVPSLLLLRDPSRARNGMHSFLAKDHGNALSSFLETEEARVFESSSLKSTIEQVLDRLAISSDQSHDWGLVYAIVGELPIVPPLAEKMGKAIENEDFIRLFKERPLYGILAIKTASSQARNLTQGRLHENLKKQLVEIAHFFNEMHLGKTDIRGHETDLCDDPKIAGIFLDAALDLSVTGNLDKSVAAEFAIIVNKLVDANNSLIKEYRPVIQRLCEELPLIDAKFLWPLLIRLRAS